jgi:CelD/BcsL family acetyltransferase involved in cellulose biosynthesis
VSVLRDGEVVALGVLCFRTIRRRGLRIRQAYLHECGIPQIDSLRIECNGMMTRPDHGADALATLIAQLRERIAVPAWDELVLSGIDADASCTAAAMSAGMHVGGYTDPAHFISLEPLRQQNKTYLDSLVSKTRRKIRTAGRDYENSLGPLALDVSGSVGEALGFLDGLKELHQQYWLGRGQAGAFSSPHFRDFHQQLIREVHDCGGVRLLRVRAGDAVVGYLYFLLRDGVANFYQCGYRYGLVPRHEIPGFICIAAAIEYFRQEGFGRFEFLAGRQQYKSELASEVKSRSWYTLQRPLMKLRLDRVAVRVGKKIRDRWGRLRETPTAASA